MKKTTRLTPIRYCLTLCMLLLAFCYVKADGISEKPNPNTSPASLKSNVTLQDTKILKGIVKDETGEPIIGASISIEGAATGTITNMDGNFEIHVEPGQVIKISYVGFISQQIKITNQSFLSITLTEDTRMLEEVVVMGYGTATKKKDLSMAVSTVKLGSENLGRPTNLANILQGKVAGVSINQSGDPTSSGSINIRGKGNRNGDQILYVVDGVVGAPYNSADVENITILKDAASASIYGSNAGAGGVVLITTKQAIEGKAKIDANAWWGVQRAWRLPEVLTASEFNQVWKDVTTAKGRDLPNAYNPLIFPYGDVTRTDWLDEVFRAGNMQHYDFTIRGGTESLKALASVAYTDTEGTILTTYQKNLTLRLNVDFQLTKWLKLSQRLMYDYTNGKGNANGGGIGGGPTGTIFNAMAYPRSATVFEYENEQKLYGGLLPRWAAGDFHVEADLKNPVAMLEKIRVNNPVDRLFSTSSLELKPIKGVTIKSDFSFDVGNDRLEKFQAKFTEPGLQNNENYRQIYAQRGYRYMSDNIITYTNEFRDVHYLSVMGGLTFQKSDSRVVRAAQMGLSNETEHGAILSPNATWYTDENVELRPENIAESSSRSYLARVAYTYDDRYIINGSWRHDQSSLLHPDRNGKNFFAVSGAWKITSEKFLPDLEPLSFAKLRFGWGQVGSVNSLRSFAYRELFEDIRSPIFFGDETQGGRQGIAKSSVANPYIKWEKTEQTSVGMDFEFLKNSLSVSVDYFYKNTKDLIEKQTSVSQAGVENPKKYMEANVGRVVNKGWEITIGYTKNIKNFTIDVGGNFSKYESEVKSLGKYNQMKHTDQVNKLDPFYSFVGHPWTSYNLIQTDGIFQTQEEIDAYTWYNPETGRDEKIQPQAKVGDLKFVDLNKDGKINDDDRVLMGAYDNPDFFYGFNLGASWKDLSINMQFQGVAGVKIFNGVKAMTYAGDKGTNMSRDVLDSFNYNPQSGIPNLAVVSDENGNYTTVSDFFLEKGDYLRMKSLNVSYNFPKRLLSEIGLKGTGVRFYFNADNLFTITGYKGFDPEVGNNGLDNGRYPVARTFSFGLNVTL